MKLFTPICLLSLVLIAGCDWSEAPDSIPQPATPVESQTVDSGSENELDWQANQSAETDPGTTTARQDWIAGRYRLLSWNVESNGADSNVIAEQLASLNQNDRYDAIALSEVLPEDLKRFRMSLGKHYKYVYSKSGRNDRLEILYNEDRFERVRDFELNEINIRGRYRAPLVVHLRERSSGTEFLVMVNHLARGKAEIRQQQASQLVEWARGQTLPIIALGDYNFDYVFATGKGNPGFVNMMRDNIWKWVEPEQWIDTNWYDDPESPDGEDDYPGSMLDFAFVAGPAKSWKATCKILIRDGDFPDDESTSDHRPFELLLSK